MKCLNCGSEMPEGSKFCSSCGSRSESKKKFCTNCGKQILEGADYCLNCGTKIKSNNQVKDNDDNNALIYLIGAIVSFVLPWFTYYVPFVNFINWISPVGVISFLAIGMSKYPKKTYFKILLIIYISFTAIAIIFTLLAFITCVNACANFPY